MHYYCNDDDEDEYSFSCTTTTTMTTITTLAVQRLCRCTVQVYIAQHNDVDWPNHHNYSENYYSEKYYEYL